MTRVLVGLLVVAGCGNETVNGARLETPPTHEQEAPPTEEREAPPAGGGSPIAIEPGGFTAVADVQEAASGHTRYSSPPGGACMVDVDWWRPMPPDPGGPMMVASRRPVTVAGVETTVVTTSMFEGTEREVDAVFLSDTGYQVRIVFDSCTVDEESSFLAGVRLAS